MHKFLQMPLDPTRSRRAIATSQGTGRPTGCLCLAPSGHIVRTGRQFFDELSEARPCSDPPRNIRPRWRNSVLQRSGRACCFCPSKVRFTRTQTSREVRILPLADIAGLLCDHFVGESLQRVGYLRAERSVSLHELLMCMRGFAARRASIDVILEKNHMTDAAARAAPKISNR